MSLDIEPEEMFKDWLPKVRRANRKDDRLIKLRLSKEEVDLDEGIMDKVKAGIKKVLGTYRLDKAQRKASSELRSYYDDWIASGGSEERFMELVHGTGMSMSGRVELADMTPDEIVAYSVGYREQEESGEFKS